MGLRESRAWPGEFGGVPQSGNGDAGWRGAFGMGEGSGETRVRTRAGEIPSILVGTLRALQEPYGPSLDSLALCLCNLGG